MISRLVIRLEKKFSILLFLRKLTFQPFSFQIKAASANTFVFRLKPPTNQIAPGNTLSQLNGLFTKLVVPQFDKHKIFPSVFLNGLFGYKGFGFLAGLFNSGLSKHTGF